tara:strand:- start:175 stop:381 length:207 start_codon:yes stop_codon:yes gene_type:complete
MKKIEITPQTYIDMNKEMEEEGTPLRIVVPTQEAIDKWLSQSPEPYKAPPKVDMVQEMWDKIGGRPND